MTVVLRGMLRWLLRNVLDVEDFDVAVSASTLRITNLEV